MKVCRRCNISKPYFEFYERVGSFDGYTNTCKKCKIDANREWQAANPEKAKAAKRKHHLANIDEKKAAIKLYVEENRTVHRNACKRWRMQNPNKALAIRAKRRAAKLNATPGWADQEKIAEFYFAADFLGMVTGEWHQVDHVVPLIGKVGKEQVVCGLHWEGNLQVLTSAENAKKSNFQWPDMPA